MREQIDQAVDEALQGKELEITVKESSINDLPSLFSMINKEALVVLEDHSWILMAAEESGEWEEQDWRTFRVLLIDTSSRTWYMAWMTLNLEKIRVVR